MDDSTEPLLKKSSSHDPVSSKASSTTTSNYFSENNTRSHLGNIQSDAQYKVNMLGSEANKHKSTLFSKHRKPMKPQDTLTLNWWEKWRKYGRFPWKLVLHVLTTILCTILVWIEVSGETPYNVTTTEHFYRVFFPQDNIEEYGFGVVEAGISVYTIEDCVKKIDESMQSFVQFPNKSLGVYRLITPDPLNAHAKLTVKRFANESVIDPHVRDADLDTIIDRWDITVNPHNYGPLDVEDYQILQQFFYMVISMELQFKVYSVQLSGVHPIEHEWTITMKFNNEERGGRMRIRLEILKEMVSIEVPWSELMSFTEVLLDSSLTVLCLLSIIISIRSVSRSFLLYQELKQKLRKRRQRAVALIQWRDLPLGVKIKFFNVWFLISIISNLCLIVAAILDIVSHFGTEAFLSDTVNLLLGLGTLFSWVNLMRWAGIDKKYTVILGALGRSMPNILRFLLSALPIFIGYALFGILNFSKDTQRFANLDEAFLTLFSLQNGDDIQSTFRSTSKHPIVSRIYFYTFLFIGIYAISNIFIAIIEDAYFTGKKEWSVDDQKKPITKDAPQSATEIPQTPSQQKQDLDAGETDFNDNEQLWNWVLSLYKEAEEQPTITNKRTRSSISIDSQTDESNNDGTVNPKEVNELYSEMTQFLRQQREQMQADMERQLQDVFQRKFGVRPINNLHTNNNNNNNNNIGSVQSTPSRQSVTSSDILSDEDDDPKRN